MSENHTKQEKNTPNLLTSHSQIQQWMPSKSVMKKFTKFELITILSIIVMSAPQRKTQYLLFRSQVEYFLLSWKIPEVISRPSILFHNQRKYLLYQTYVHTSFLYESELTRNMTLNGCIYYVLYLYITAFLLCEMCIRMSKSSTTFKKKGPNFY